jgi:hypothetical protein
METFITGTMTTGEWIIVAGSAALLLLSVVPVLWAWWLFVNMSDGAVDDAIRDAQRLAVVKNRVRGRSAPVVSLSRRRAPGRPAIGRRSGP